jgi:hypothetical protein
MYISCIGVVFATIWAGGLQQYERRAAHSHSISTDFRSGMGPVTTTDIGVRGNQKRPGREFALPGQMAQEKHLEDPNVLVIGRGHKRVKLHTEESLESTTTKVSIEIAEK